MRRIQRLKTGTALALAGVLAFGLVGIAVTGVGAEEKTVEIVKVAEAGFEGVSDRPVFIAIVGTDDRPGVGGARADAIHLVGINPLKRQGTMLNIPRDTYINIPGHGRSKINESNTYGKAQLVARTLSEFVGVTVNYVVTTNFQGFTDLVDESGGVMVDVPVAVNDSFSSAQVPAGVHLMSGAAALAYSRARHGVAGGDFGRTANQGRVLLGALGQVQKQGPTTAGTIQLVARLMRHVRGTYGLDAAELYKLSRLALVIKPESIRSVVMPGTTGSAGGASVVLPTAAARPMFADFADDAVLETTAP